MSVIADPAKLRELAARMKRAGREMEALQKEVLGALDRSGWNDSERQKFEAGLSRDLRAAVIVGRKLQHEYPSALERKARALDDFRR